MLPQILFAIHLVSTDNRCMKRFVIWTIVLSLSAVVVFEIFFRVYGPDIAANFVEKGKNLNSSNEEAAADFTLALFFDHKNYEAYYLRGMTRTNLHDFDGAISDFDHALVLLPKNYPLYFIRGRAKMYKGDFTGALQDFDQCIKMDPQHEFATQDRAIAEAAINAKNGASQKSSNQ